MRLRQVELRDIDNRYGVFWVDETVPLHVGTKVTGKDNRKWEVTKLYLTTLEHDEIKHGWAVGGL